MSKDDTPRVFELIKGLKEVDPAQLAEFRKAMTEDVIPEIARIVETRRLKAAENRARQLKC
jgi:hypothetical protein